MNLRSMYFEAVIGCVTYQRFVYKGVIIAVVVSNFETGDVIISDKDYSIF